MANLITQYDNGTFEDIAANWDAMFFNINSFERSNEFAFEGTYSAKVFLEKINELSYWQLMLIAFPAGVDMSTYEFKMKIRVDDNIDDRIYFMAFGINPEGSTGNISIPVRASDAKETWAELRVNFKGHLVDLGNGLGPQNYIVLYLVKNFKQLKTDAPGLFIRYPNLEDYIDYNQEGDYNNFDDNDPIFLDAATSEEKAIPAILDQQFDGTKLYYRKKQFLLVIDNKVYQIDEPIKWDQVLIQVKFDESTSRYRFEFSDKDVLLGFDAAAGYDLLKALREKNGTDAEASLKFGYYDETGEVLEIVFEASLNFQSYRRHWKYIEMNCERRSLAQKLWSRFDTKTNVFAEQTIDGTALVPLERKNMFLHPRLLKYTADYIYNKNIDVNVPDPPVVDTEYIITPPLKMISSNVDGADSVTPPQGQFFYTGFELPAGVDKRVLAVILRGIRFEFDITEIVPQQVLTRVGVTHLGNVSGTPLILPGAFSDFQLHGLFPKHVVVNTPDISGEIDMIGDDALFVTILIGLEGSVALPPIANFRFINVDGWSMNILEKTVFSSSKVQGVRIFELLNRQLEIVTDKTNVLKSNFFGRTDLGYPENGCGYNHYVLNGLMVRGFNDRAFPWSTKEWMNALMALWCMGMSVERDNDNNEWVRFEPLEYFFRPVRLMTLNTVSDFDEEMADEYIFNELSIRFKKYPQDNQADSLNDWMTEFSFVGPLQLVANKFEKNIDILLSSYYLEYTRREGFNVNPTNSYETDNDAFMISCLDAVSQMTGIRIDSVDGKIIVYGIVPIIPGDTFTIAGGTPIDGNYTADNVEIPFAFNQTVITISNDPPISDSSTLSATISFAEVVRAKRTEGFSSVTGIDFSASVYNLEHHLKRILLRWAKYFQSGWAPYVRQNEPLKYFSQFVEGKNNMNLRTVSTNPCDAQGEIDDDAWMNSADLDKPLFGDCKYTFKAPMTWDAINYIRKCFEGRSPDNKNYGYIRFLGPDSVYLEGYILEMKFNPVSQQCTFTLIQKYNG
jgi:hypothetical protein